MDSSNEKSTPIVDLNIPAVEELIQMDMDAETFKGNISETQPKNTVETETILSSMVEGVPGGDMQVESKGVDGGDSDKSNESMNVDEFVSTVVEPEVEVQEPEVEVQEPEVEVQEPAKESDTDEDVPLSELMKRTNLAKENPETTIVERVNPIVIMSEEESESPEPSNQRKSKRKKSATTHRRILPLRSAKKPKIVELEEESESEVPEPAPKPTSKPIRSNQSSKEIKKTVLEEFLIDEKFLREQHLEEILEYFEFQGWMDLLKDDDPVDMDIVAEFYKKVTKVERGTFVYINFNFRGQDLTISSRELAFALDLDHTGFDTFTKKQWPENITEEKKEEMMRLVCNYYDPNVTDLSTNHMLPIVKILHRLLVSTILPRGSKPALSQIHDILVLDQLIRKQKINLPKLILHQMEYASQYNQVGHARVVKKILQMHGLYEPKKEVSIVKPLSLNNFHRWGIQYNEDQGWVRRSGLEDTAKGDGSRTAVNLEIKDTLIKIQKDISELKGEVMEIRNRLDEFEDLKSFIKAEFAKLGSRTSP